MAFKNPELQNLDLADISTTVWLLITPAADYTCCAGVT